MIKVLTCLDTSTPRLSEIYRSTSPGIVKGYMPLGVSRWSQLIAAMGKAKPPKGVYNNVKS
jgi:hypothetical protein